MGLSGTLDCLSESCSGVLRGLSAVCMYASLCGAAPMPPVSPPPTKTQKHNMFVFFGNFSVRGSFSFVVCCRVSKHTADSCRPIEKHTMLADVVFCVSKVGAETCHGSYICFRMVYIFW